MAYINGNKLRLNLEVEGVSSVNEKTGDVTGLEETSNKTDSINGTNPSEEKYPSESAVANYVNTNVFCGLKVIVNTIVTPRVLNIIHTDGTEEEVTSAGTYEHIIAFYSRNGGSISVTDGVYQKFNSFYDGSTAVSKPFYVPYTDLTIKVQN